MAGTSINEVYDLTVISSSVDLNRHAMRKFDDNLLIERTGSRAREAMVMGKKFRL